MAPPMLGFALSSLEETGSAAAGYEVMFKGTVVDITVIIAVKHAHVNEHP